MHVIRLNIDPLHLNQVLLSNQMVYLLLGVFIYLTLKYSVTVFGTKHNVILALINRM